MTDLIQVILKYGLIHEQKMATVCWLIICIYSGTKHECCGQEWDKITYISAGAGLKKTSRAGLYNEKLI